MKTSDQSYSEQISSQILHHCLARRIGQMATKLCHMPQFDAPLHRHLPKNTKYCHRRRTHKFATLNDCARVVGKVISLHNMMLIHLWIVVVQRPNS